MNHMLPRVAARTGHKHLLETRSIACGGDAPKPTATRKRETPTNRMNGSGNARLWIVATRTRWSEAVLMVRPGRTYSYEPAPCSCGECSVDFTAPVHDVQILRDVVTTSAFTYWKAEPGHEAADICGYCGSDTTGARYGFDCCVCGGN